MSPAKRLSGFSLLETSIVLIIVATLLAGLLPGITTYRETAAREQARRQIELAQEAMLGFAIRHGRLPCPATADSRGLESPEGGGNCTQPWNGLLPSATLGLSALDPWGNPWRYAVTRSATATCASEPCATRENGLRDSWNTETPPAPDLHICNSSHGRSGSGASAECASGSALTKDAFAVIYSLGSNGPNPASDDERANLDDDRLFVARESSAAPDAYDDLTLWISSGLLYSRLMAAGRLP